MSETLKVPDHVLQEQYASSDPSVSAWVAANAGSGKTHVLTQRVIRLMLAGNAPDRILCLTFTKAAAANMKTRVFDTLADWTMMEDDMLDEAIRKSSGQAVTPEIRNRARRLFARALDTPGGLKIQTIHAFCEGLLHQFPLEANVPGHFETLQEMGQAALLAEARAQVLGGHVRSQSVMHHFQMLVSAASQDAIEDGVAALVRNRASFLNWINVGIEDAILPLYQALDVDPTDTPNSLMEDCLENLPVPEVELQTICRVAGESEKPTDRNVHERLVQFSESSSTLDRFAAIEEICLKKDGMLRSESRMVTAFVRKQVPNASEILKTCGEEVFAARNKLKSLSLLSNSRNIFYVAEAVLERYAGLKRAHGVIDFDDQVEKCAALLNRTEIRDWIRYRLDRGIDHVLVDEAQDTSPRQWEIINAITADFHSGESAAVRTRTVFVVGDEKQSIYSFQGARPAEFASQQAGLGRSVKSARKHFHSGRLSLSFRSTPDILHAVDLIFGNKENRRGLLQSGEQPAHDAVRAKDPGEVQVWPLFKKDQSDEPDNWFDPVDRTGHKDPATRLADRIAASIAEWVGKPLPGSDEVLRYQDVLVLVRKRDRFITALTRTMKDRGLKVAGADRLVLTDHIAVEDLLALGSFILLPQDDLNLACVLKGPLFSLDEEKLLSLAHDRGQNTLFGTIVDVAKSDGNPNQELANRLLPTLEKLLHHGRKLDVFEFFAWLLGPLGMRKAILLRLGMEAEDVLDAFLDETIAFAGEGGIGLQSFISHLNQANPEIKREVELDRDEVRILTVHASKGLEARVVFLVDPCNAPWTQKHRPPILNIATKNGDGYIWLPTSELHIDATREATETIKLAAEEEYRRLLYVGMTRAADRLVVCGFRGANEPKFDHWHSMVHSALENTANRLEDECGNFIGLSWTESGMPTEKSDIIDHHDEEVPDNTLEKLPLWLATPVPHEKPLPQPLTPTGAFTLIENQGSEQPAIDQLNSSDHPAFAIQRGRAVHRLLELLPDVSSDKRTELAVNYLEKIGADWRADQRDAAWIKVKSILEDKRFSQLFSGTSQAEVSLTGKLATRSGERLIAGQIDRLVVLEDQVAIIDYKTGYTIPDETPEQYLTQMALYRELVGQIYPAHQIACYFMWVNGPELVAVPENLLKKAFEKIKNI
ncbi:MAG: double-strand break repair helicase AddA [Rhizobiaceae bacterium]